MMFDRLFDKNDEWCQEPVFWLCPATEAFYGYHPEVIYLKCQGLSAMDAQNVKK